MLVIDCTWLYHSLFMLGIIKAMLSLLVWDGRTIEVEGFIAGFYYSLYPRNPKSDVITAKFDMGLS